MDDSSDSADICGLAELYEVSNFVVPVVFEGGEGDIDPDFVAKLEAVGDGPGGIGDTNGDFVDVMGFDAVTGGGFGDVDDH